jgi:hypothetical protein
VKQRGGEILGTLEDANPLRESHRHLKYSLPPGGMALASQASRCRLKCLRLHDLKFSWSKSTPTKKTIACIVWDRMTLRSVVRSLRPVVSIVDHR